MGNNKQMNKIGVTNRWIEWNHFLIPNYPKEIRDTIRIILLLLGHCLNCTALDGCYFVENNMPTFPLHEKCDCNIMEIAYGIVKINVKSDCAIEKFTKYIFAGDNKSKGKKEIFKSLGFDIKDSSRLKLELELQSTRNYLQGNYILKNLDSNGQRVAIPTILSGKTFYSGWIIEPNGKLRNTTPFAGWGK